VKKLLVLFLTIMFSTPALSDSRFGELTEMFDEKKRIDKIYLD